MVQLTTQKKKRLLAGGFAGLILWPWVHIALVLIFGVSPWKLYGWGMYSTPQFEPAVQLIELRNGKSVGLIEQTNLPEELRMKIRRFQFRRMALGRLAPPDPLASDILAALPRLSGIAVVVRERKLNPRTALIEESSTPFAFEREGRP